MFICLIGLFAMLESLVLKARVRMENCHFRTEHDKLLQVYSILFEKKLC